MDNHFHTGRPANPVFCHPDFLERLESYRTQPIGKRAALLLQRLLIDPERLHYKSTQGENKGWRRSRLGGSSGSHFYAWWAPAGALPIKDFHAPAGSLFLRDIRHHDDHSPLPPQHFPADYLPISVPEVRAEDFGPSPWTPQQSKFASARDNVRLLKGHPGSGKTTALLHAADQSPASHILYLTYSSDLAILARSFFERYCSAARHYHVSTFPLFVRQLLRSSAPPVPLAEQRSRFRAEVASLSRSLGAWAQNIPALFDEFHAHIVGAALPARAGRFNPTRIQRRHDRDYIAARSRFIGPHAAEAANAAATRLEKSGGPIARLFPDLQLAWSAAQLIPNLTPADLPWDCIAIDECQDLTPIETFLVARLAKRIQELRGRPIPVLIAGDEAQTVRPTDFEWAWLSDIFHTEIATPSSHKLSANLRSPRQIAELINRVWDLYGHLDKHDRPSGQGWASIDDDAADQILYCAAAPGEELSLLLSDLQAREGLAIVSFDGHRALIPNALSPSEIKGLDFHSVCVIDAGAHIEKVVPARYGATDIDSISRRLAIDQLRVAISRPTERLIWLDISPNPTRLTGSLSFLNLQSALTPAALIKSLQEEALDVEERIQRCQDDARQYLAVRPDLAWSRAHQAVALLGDPPALSAVSDPLTRRTAYLTLAEVSFSLAQRKAKLSPELGHPDLFRDAAAAAAHTENPHLASVLAALADLPRYSELDQLNAQVELMRRLPEHLPHLPPWVLLELGTQPQQWIASLERVEHIGANAAICVRVLPPFYQAIGLPDAAERTARLRARAVTDLIKTRHYPQALEILTTLPERNHKLEAQCHEGAGDLAAAALSHRAAGNLEAAIDCYRRIPDVSQTLAAIRELKKPHPAAPALEWVAELQALAAKRPDNFQRVIKPEEKKALEDLLESALGVQRRKPAAKKAATKKVATKKAAPKKAAAKKATPRKVPLRKTPNPYDYF